jgi:hypothetical protein
MSYKVSLSYAGLDESTSAVTVLLHLEFWKVGSVRWTGGGGGGGGVHCFFKIIFLWKDDEEKIIFKIPR